jgi:hypothetical protein
MSDILIDPRFGLPPGHLLDVRGLPNGARKLSIEGLGGNHRTVNLPPQQTADVLLTYARRVNIPIPRRAAKSLAGTEEGGLVMTLTMETAVT